jgi:hypothetical protein
MKKSAMQNAELGLKREIEATTGVGGVLQIEVDWMVSFLIFDVEGATDRVSSPTFEFESLLKFEAKKKF